MPERAAADAVEVRSYRSVFDLERRIYRIDRVRLNPSGVPVRGLVYFVLLVPALLVLDRLPLVGWLLAALPWLVRDLVLPAGLAALATVLRIDGRPFHQALRALVRHAAGPRHLYALRAGAAPGARWLPGRLLLIPDGSDPGIRRLRFTGPGALLVATAHQRTVRHGRPRGLIRPSHLTLRELPGRRQLPHGQVLEVAADVRVELRPARRKRLPEQLQRDRCPPGGR